MKINYTEIMKEVAKDTGYSQVQTKEIINTFLTKIKEHMKQGFEVNILSFCKFKVGEASKRKMYNFQEKTVKPMPERMVPKCEFVRSFKMEIK